MISRKNTQPIIGALAVGMLMAAPALAEPAPATSPSTQDATPAPHIAAANIDIPDPAAKANAKADHTSTETTAGGAIQAPAAWRKLVSVQAGMGQGQNGNVEGDRVLRLVVRADTGKLVAAKVGLSVGLALLGGGIHGGTANGFSKRNLRGDDIETLPSPAFGALQGLITASLDSYFAANPDAIPNEARIVQASAGEWSLIYQKLGDALTPYELRHDVAIGFPMVRKFLRSSGGEGIHCHSEPVAASLEQWQADDYALVKQTSAGYAEKCIEQFAAQLPVLFPNNGRAIEVAAAEAEIPAEADNTPAADREVDGLENLETAAPTAAAASLL